jgi:1-acyl-sn-glycerol-3-phosphate acyltransferase
VFYWLLKWVFLGPLLRMVFRPRTEGAEHVPEEGPAILASNHLSYADWLFMPLTLTRRVTFVAKAEYFNGKGLKGWLQKSFFSGAGQVPIDRSAPTQQRAVLAAKVLAPATFGIYPGDPPTPALPRQDGVACLPRDGVRIRSGRHRRRGSSREEVRPSPARVRFGKPLDFSRYEGLEDDRFILRSITDEIMYEIMRLSGQEYVDLYATKAKALDKEVLQGRRRGEAGQRAGEPRAQSLSMWGHWGGCTDPATEAVETTITRRQPASWC